MNFIVDNKAPVFLVKYIEMGEIIFFFASIRQYLICCYCYLSYFFYFTRVFTYLLSGYICFIQYLINPLPNSNNIWASNQGISLHLRHDTHTNYCFTCATRKNNCSTSPFYSAASIENIYGVFLVFS